MGRNSTKTTSGAVEIVSDPSGPAGSVPCSRPTCGRSAPPGGHSSPAVRSIVGIVINVDIDIVAASSLSLSRGQGVCCITRSSTQQIGE